MPLERTRHGLLARVPEYEPLRAFSHGGRYWDLAPQQLLRAGALAEFLPAVEIGEDDRGAFGRFFPPHRGADWLCRSQPVGRRGIPPVELDRLRCALEALKLRAAGPGVQPQNREFIEKFRLPDIAIEPELYRLAGPWWDRRLQILWGCERTREASLPAASAAAKLAPDRWHFWRPLLLALLLLALLLGLAWALFHGAAAWRRSASPTSPPAAGLTNPGPVTNPSPVISKPPRPARPGAPDARTAAACQLFLVDQTPPDADGLAQVTLEVRTSTKPVRPVPVEAWSVGGVDISHADRFHAKLKAGDHTITAAIRDADDKAVEISAIVTVIPNKVTTTAGKVSLHKK